MVVGPTGVVYANTWSGEYYGHATPPAGGFLVALQDTAGAGKANVIERFGETVRRARGGTGVGMYKGALYAEVNDRIVRYALPAGSIVPQGAPETVVSGCPWAAIIPCTRSSSTPKDACTWTSRPPPTPASRETANPRSPGDQPCTELKTRGGIWRYDANKTNQKFSPDARYATGIRNAEGFAIDSTGRFSSPSTDATSCMRIGLNSKSLTRKRRCRRRS